MIGVSAEGSAWGVDEVTEESPSTASGAGSAGDEQAVAPKITPPKQSLWTLDIKLFIA